MAETCVRNGDFGVVVEVTKTLKAFNVQPCLLRMRFHCFHCQSCETYVQMYTFSTKKR